MAKLKINKATANKLYKFAKEQGPKIGTSLFIIDTFVAKGRLGHATSEMFEQAWNKACEDTNKLTTAIKDMPTTIDGGL